MAGISRGQHGLVSLHKVGLDMLLNTLANFPPINQGLVKLAKTLKQFEEKDFLNRTDDLTGLLTRKPFMHFLAQLDRSGDKNYALVFFDLDRFKPINDEYGHAFGDLLLKQIAHRFSNTASHASRIGGDEFVGIVEFDDELGLHIASSSINGIFDLPFEIGDKDESLVVSVGASLGIRILTTEVNVEREIHDADTAMYQSKRKGGFYTVYSQEVLENSRRYRQDAKAHLALNINQIQLHYQIIYRLGTGSADMVEASLFLPGENIEFFMSGIERRGAIIRPLFIRTFEQACQAAATWPPNCLGKKPILSFNMPVEIMGRGLHREILRILESTQLPPHRVQFELLERGRLAGNDEAKAAISDLKLLGVGFFLDDVGEKNANLEIIDEYEKHLIGYKIGTTFTLNIATDPKKRSLVEMLLFGADKLGLATVVEGIETEEALRLVAPYSPPYIQGFLLHRPSPDGPSLHEGIKSQNSICVKYDSRTRLINLNNPVSRQA